MKRGLIGILGLIIILVGLGQAGAALTPQQILDKEMDYIVKKGDTLWDICQRFYKNPFLWPRLWWQNQYITNPHWIYPGDRIRLYPYRILIKEEIPPTLKEVTPGFPPPPGKIKLSIYPEVYTAGFITEEVEGIGSIVGARDEKTMLCEADEVYLAFHKEILVKEGDKFTIFRVGDPLIHPVTQRVIGRKVLILGTVEIISAEGDAKIGLIALSNNPIFTGDRLFPYLTPREDLAINKVEGTLYGWVVAAKKDDVEEFGEGDVIYIDRGENNDIKPGHIFQVFHRGQWVIDPISQRKVRLPDNPIGQVVVITTQKKTSTALITKSRLPIHVGDEIMAITD
jgi:hypothetical protein